MKSRKNGEKNNENSHAGIPKKMNVGKGSTGVVAEDEYSDD